MTAPTPPPDAAQAVVAAYQALLTAEADQAVAYETYMGVPLEDSRPTRLAYDRAIGGRHKAQDALYATCAALLLTPAQVAYRAYVAALVAEDAARQVYDDTAYIFEEDKAAAKVAVQVATENKHSAAAAWQAIEAQP